MALLSGSRLGPYEIAGPLGAGGMGEVYRARDTKLNRDVALKVLPEFLAGDPERRARFEREAHVLASLNHPNIAQIHGFEDSGEVRALVMELVDGPTLANRIAQGLIPLSEALPIAKQIAEALEAAHELGIIHRDLKPANIKVRPDGTVKVLDFGLAKALDPTTPAAASATMSPTISLQATQAGVILGTAAYMAPEQAKGKPVDKRADIWAFGCVLYEMLTGRRAFEGEDITETLARVLMKEPDLSTIHATTPPAVQRLIRRCLVKERRERVPDIAVARMEIAEALAAPALPQPPPTAPRAPLTRTHVAWAAGGLLTGALIAAVVVWRMAAPDSAGTAPITRFSLSVPATIPLSSGVQTIAFSADGSRIAFTGNPDGTSVSQIFVRALDQLEAIPVRGTDRGGSPFFSPDGAWIGFVASGRLMKVPVSGGAATVITDIGGARGAVWLPDNSIVYARSGGGGGLWRIGADGRSPARVTTPDKAKEAAHLWPEVLPDGRTVLFTIQPPGSTDYNTATIAAVALDTGERRTVIEGAAYPRYMNTGHLLAVRAGGIIAVPLDLATLRPTASPVVVVDAVATRRDIGAAHFGVSADGSLAYVPGGEGTSERQRTLLWVDRRGAVTPIPMSPRGFESPRISPNGRQIAVNVSQAGRGDVWLYDLTRGTFSRFTFATGETPVWSPDGAQIAYAAGASPNQTELRVKPADGSGEERKIGEAGGHLHLTSWSPRTDLLLAAEGVSSGASDVWRVRLPNGTPERIATTSFGEGSATVSPDGRWLAYRSNESGRDEVYVQAFPGPGGKWQISPDGGVEPVWARTGRELFYRNGDELLAVKIESTEATLRAGSPVPLFEGRYGFGQGEPWYDVTPDGQRFVMIKAEDSAITTPIIVIQNWRDELKRLVPKP